MQKIQRNGPCPCGSGLKYKKCCGTDPLSKLSGLLPAIRMKGGVAYDPEVPGWVAIVHKWDNMACQGEPDEWRYPQIFATEEQALSYYKTNIRPQLERMMRQMEQEHTGSFFTHHKIEE